MDIHPVVGIGGTGKTTIGTHLGVLAYELGLNVLIVDADPQASSSVWRFQRGNNDVKVVTCVPRDVSKLLRTATVRGVDLVIVDNAPQRHEHMQAVVTVADVVLPLSAPTPFDIVVAHSWVTWLATLSISPCIVITQAPPPREGIEAPMVREARHAFREMVEAFPDSTAATARGLWGAQITRRHVVIHATAAGRAATELEPVGLAAREYRGLWVGVTRLLMKAYHDQIQNP